MKSHLKMEKLIRAAKSGDKKAEAEFFSELAVRFSKLAALELQKYPILTKQINAAQVTNELGQNAVDEVKQVYPITSPGWSLLRAMNVLHNSVDNFIANALTDLAKNGDGKAENLLFLMLRKKLTVRLVKKKWRDTSNGP